MQHFTSITPWGVSIRLLKGDDIIAEVPSSDESDWDSTDVTDHHKVAMKFIDYVVSIRAQLLKTEGRKHKNKTVNEDWDSLLITYKDGVVVRFHKDDLIVPTSTANAA